MKTERNSLLGELVFPVILLCALILLILVVYGVEITLVTDELVNVVTPAQARAWQATPLGRRQRPISGLSTRSPTIPSRRLRRARGDCGTTEPRQ